MSNLKIISNKWFKNYLVQINSCSYIIFLINSNCITLLLLLHAFVFQLNYLQGPILFLLAHRAMQIYLSKSNLILINLNNKLHLWELKNWITNISKTFAIKTYFEIWMSFNYVYQPKLETETSGNNYIWFFPQIND